MVRHPTCTTYIKKIYSKLQWTSIESWIYVCCHIRTIIPDLFPFTKKRLDPPFPSWSLVKVIVKQHKLTPFHFDLLHFLKYVEVPANKKRNIWMNEWMNSSYIYIYIYIVQVASRSLGAISPVAQNMARQFSFFKRLLNLFLKLTMCHFLNCSTFIFLCSHWQINVYY